MKTYLINQDQLNATIDLIHKGKFDLNVSLILSVLKNLHSLPERKDEPKETKSKKDKEQ